jgi:nitroimidazol reductase NimA-like FMN-containing flavoprotein (pyridoxamine 5'-phosphate oxidase superfamily)
MVTGVAEKEDGMSLAMTRQERETFLADVHVGIISIADEGRGPLAVPIWYTYEPGGELQVVTARASRKGRLLARVDRFSLCAQTETPPYQHVSVEGPIVATEAADLERDLRPLAHRYLGADMGDRYIEQTRHAHEQAENVLIRMRPERWLTVDFAKTLGAL